MAGSRNSPRLPPHLVLTLATLLLVAASIGLCGADVSKSNRVGGRNVLSRARKLFSGSGDNPFSFPSLPRSRWSKIGWTTQISMTPAKPTSPATVEAESAQPAQSAQPTTVPTPTPKPTTPSTPADPAPSKTTPIDPTPVDPTPVDPTPVDPTPVDPTPSNPPAKPSVLPEPIPLLYPNIPYKTTPLMPTIPLPAMPTTSTTTPSVTEEDTDATDATAAPIDTTPVVPFQDAAPPSAPPPPPEPTGPCPPKPDVCDFYFQDSQDTLPVFSLKGANGDTRIGGPIEAQVRGAVIDVIAANSELSDYICRDGVSLYNTPPAENTPGESPDNQFYATQDGIQMRTFQSAGGGPLAYLGKYVRVNLTAIQISIFNMVSNVNKGQNYSYFPEERRCVVFQIAP